MTQIKSLQLEQSIESKIFTFRGSQVMIDRDLADLYQVETRVLNQAVKRNQTRFPELFCFQLNDDEFQDWKSQVVMSNADKMGLRRAPFVFTEQGVAMLSAVLKSDTAVQISVQIINTFVAMRKAIQGNASIYHRLDYLERKNTETDQKLEQVFKALESKNEAPSTGIFFDGQVFDAYSFIADIIKQAEKSIIVVDNYVDETVLTLLTKRKKGVQATIYTKTISQQLKLDLAKHNAQYPAIEIKTLADSHDRFLIVDKQTLYHIGASLKDLGKKWFAFSKMNSLVQLILNQLEMSKKS